MGLDMSMPFLGSLFKSKYDFKNLLPDFTGSSAGLVDPRKRLTKEDVAEKRTKKKKIRKYGLYKNLKPGEDLEIRGYNMFADERRRARQVEAGLRADAEQLGLAGALEKASADAGRSADVTEGALERRQRALGINLTERQQRAQTRGLSLARKLANVRARGATRRGSLARAEAAAGSAGGLEDQLLSVENAGLTQLANAAGQKDITGREAIAKREEDRQGFAGGIIGTVASFFSSEGYKRDHGKEEDLLKKLKKVRVHRWQYHGDDKTHVGPFSEEFNKEFGIDTDRPDKINVIDALGVTLGAVKELSEKVHASK
jgi:hypothetical protein